MPRVRAGPLHNGSVTIYIKGLYNMRDMEIIKAHWESEGSDVKLSMPIMKVDKDRRTVHGFATLDNLDRQDDIVPADASMKAFKGFRGNLREMHDKHKAVGKVVSFKEDKYYDPETSAFYNGVMVSAYVSKGAEDTWQKVLDGTLRGFSIGGSIKEFEDTYDENLGKSIRIVKDYELYELSLVDSPANQYANVISIEKGHVGGYLAKALIENVFWCSSDDVVQLSSEASSDCPRCDKGMSNIGFVEANDADKADVVKNILSTMTKDEKEVRNMDNETIETPEVEKAVAVEEPVAEEVVEEAAVEEAAPEAPPVVEEAVEEAVVEAVEEEKAIVADYTAVVKAMAEDLTNAMTTLTDIVKALNSDFNSKIEDLQKDIAGAKQEVSAVKGNFDEFGKRVDAVEKDTAFRKSGDIGDIVQEPLEKAHNKSLWDGVFLKKSDLLQ
jgi:hypothetical protein